MSNGTGLICLTCGETTEPGEPPEAWPGWLLVHAGHIVACVPQERVAEQHQRNAERAAITPDQLLEHWRNSKPLETTVLWQTDDYTRPAWIVMSTEFVDECYHPWNETYRIPVVRMELQGDRYLMPFSGRISDAHGTMALVNDEANRAGVACSSVPIKLIPDAPTLCRDCQHARCEAGYGHRIGEHGTCPDFSAIDRGTDVRDVLAQERGK